MAITEIDNLRDSDSYHGDRQSPRSTISVIVIAITETISVIVIAITETISVKVIAITEIDNLRDSDSYHGDRQSL